MPEIETAPQSRTLGRMISICIIAGAAITGLLVISATNRHPRTDDAEVFANFIGIAPQVDGPITRLAVQDNEFLRQGDLLFQIDPRPYEYALEKAKSDFNVLEGQIGDQRRTIASQVSAVGAARRQYRQRGGQRGSRCCGRQRSEGQCRQCAGGARSPKRRVALHQQQFPSHRAFAGEAICNCRHRRPGRALLSPAQQQAVEQQRSQLLLAQAQVQSAQAAYLQTKAAQEQSHAQLKPVATLGAYHRSVHRPTGRTRVGRRDRPIQPE